MTDTPITIAPGSAEPGNTAITARARLERRARQLAWSGNAWHVIEFSIAVSAGVAAGSVALVAFGIDSLIELLAGGVVVWLFSAGRGGNAAAERAAQRVIAASFFGLAIYVGVDSLRRRSRSPTHQLDRRRPGARHRADDAAARPRQA